MNEDYAVKVKFDFGADVLSKEFKSLVKSMASVEKSVGSLVDEVKRQTSITKAFTTAIAGLVDEQSKLVKETNKSTKAVKESKKDYTELANKVKIYANGLKRAAKSSAVTSKHIVLLRDRLSSLKSEVKKLRNADVNMPNVRSTLAEVSVAIRETSAAIRKQSTEIAKNEKLAKAWQIQQRKVAESFMYADASAEVYWKTLKQKVAESYKVADAAAKEHWQTLRLKVADSYEYADAAAKEYWRTLMSKVAESYKYADADAQEYNRKLKEQRKEIQKLYSYLTKYSGRLLKVTKSTKLTYTQTELLKEKLTKVRRELNKLEKAGYSTDKIRKNLILAKRNLKDFGKETSDATSRTKEFVGWWKRFGQVAVGFTLAYRAINLIEDGIRRTVEVLKEGINLSGEFGAIQAKMALWGTMFPSNAENFADAMQKASVNIGAFRNALPNALSNIEDLTQGMDELAQHGVFATEKNMDKIVQFIDLTAMVAKASGSTVNQVRQEFQALFEGNVRAGNTLLILLRNLGVDTEELRNKIKSGVDVAENFDKIITYLTEHVDEFKNAVWDASINAAYTKWHRSYVKLIADATSLASVHKFGTKSVNVFAEALKRHADSLQNNDELTNIWTNAIENLAKGFDSVLNISEDWFSNLGKWLAEIDFDSLVKIFRNLSKSLADIGKSALVISRDLVPALEELSKVLRNVTEALPQGMLTAAWRGIITRWLFGSTPFGIIVASVSAIIDMAKDLKTAWDTGDASVLEKWVPDALVKRINKLAEGISKAKETYRGWIQVIDAEGNPLLIPQDDYDRFMSLVNKVEGLKGVPGPFKLDEKTKKEIENAYNDIYRTFQDLVKKGKLDVASELLDSIKDAVAAQADLIQEEINRVQNLYATALKRGSKKDIASLKTLLAKLNLDLDETIAKLNSLDDVIPAAAIKAKIEDIVNTFRNQKAALRGHSKEIRELASKTLVELQNALSKYGKDMDEATKEKVESFKAQLEGIVNVNERAATEVKSIWQDAFSALHDAMVDWFDKGENLIDRMVSFFKRAGSEMLTNFILGQKNIQWARTGQGTFSVANMFSGSAFLPITQGGAGTSFEGLSSIGQALSQGLEDFGSSLMYGLSDMTFDLSANLFSAGYEGASSLVEGLYNGMVDLGSSAMSGITAGLGTFLMKGIMEGDWSKAAASGGLVGITTGIGAIFGPAGAGAGAIIGGLLDMFGLSKLFGDGTEYAYYKSNIGYRVAGGQLTQSQYDIVRKESGEPMSWRDLQKIEIGYLPRLTEATNQLIQYYDRTLPGFSASLEGKTYGYTSYWRAEDEKSVNKSIERNLKFWAQSVIGPITGEFQTSLSEAMSDVDLSRFKESFKESYQQFIGEAVSGIDWSTVDSVDALNKALEEVGQQADLATQAINAIKQVNDIIDNIASAGTELSSYRQEIEGINDQFAAYAQQLDALGVDLSKVPELGTVRQSLMDKATGEYQANIKSILGIQETITPSEFQAKYFGIAGTEVANMTTDQLINFSDKLLSLGYNLDDFAKDLKESHAVEVATRSQLIDSYQRAYEEWEKNIKAVEDSTKAIDDFKKSLIGFGQDSSISYKALKSRFFASDVNLLDQDSVNAFLNLGKELLEASKVSAASYTEYMRDYISVVQRFSSLSTVSPYDILGPPPTPPKFADGGVISGPTTGYTLPVTFHGTEVITPQKEADKTSGKLTEIKELLELLVNTVGDQNGHTQRIKRVLEKWDNVDGDLVVTCVS